ncbi:MAG: cold shock domain-containing protein [Deltaproteobacteria bacterium]|nr:cold shock domain-containing protein [Deltaproteobacteria bacterium]
MEFYLNKDYPFIVNAGGFRPLKEDDRVSFDIEQGPKGPAAADVSVNSP